MGLPQAVVFDLDGTLVDVSSIQHLVASSHPDHTEVLLERFIAQSLFCPPRADVLTQMRAQAEAGRAIVILSARMERHMAVSKSWTDAHSIRWAEMHHRYDWDLKTDVDYKLDRLAQIRSRWEVVCAWDDNPHVVRAFRRTAGIHTVLVPGWLP